MEMIKGIGRWVGTQALRVLVASCIILFWTALALAVISFLAWDMNVIRDDTAQLIARTFGLVAFLIMLVERRLRGG